MADKRKSTPKKSPILEDEAQQRRERLTLALYLEGGVAIIAGMVLISEFLSQGEASKPVWVTAAVLLGILGVAILSTVLLRRVKKSA